MIDTNRDGIIDVEDLRTIWINLGRCPACISLAVIASEILMGRYINLR